MLIEDIETKINLDTMVKINALPTIFFKTLKNRIQQSNLVIKPFGGFNMNSARKN